MRCLCSWNYKICFLSRASECDPCSVEFCRSLKLQGTKSQLVTWTFLHRKYHYHQRTHAWFHISPNNYDIMDWVFIWNIIYHGNYSYSQSVAWHFFSHKSCPTDASRNTLCDREERKCGVCNSVSEVTDKKTTTCWQLPYRWKRSWLWEASHSFSWWYSLCHPKHLELIEFPWNSLY